MFLHIGRNMAWLFARSALVKRQGLHLRSFGISIVLACWLAIAAVACQGPGQVIPTPTAAPPVTERDATVVATSTTVPPVTERDATVVATSTAVPPVTERDATVVVTSTTVPPVTERDATVEPSRLEDATADRAVLIELYNATGGANWRNNDHWLTDEPIGDWYGVTTDADGRVLHLDVSQNNLTGTIPPELGSLANLEKLSLPGNNLTGTIPPELGGLTNVKELWLTSNHLTGSIPPEMANLTNLEILNLFQNQLTGPVPPDLAKLANLERIFLARNQLTGSIPPELGNLTNLTVMHLGRNQLTGLIPPELGSLTNLEYLDLSGNQLTGPIPPELGELANLMTLGLSGNQLSGCVPPALQGIPSDFHLIALQFCDGEESAKRVAVPITPTAVPVAVVVVTVTPVPVTPTAVPVAPPEQQKLEATDGAALIALYNATGGTNWKNNDKWLSDAPIGEWYGVTTGDGGQVTELPLFNNNLTGHIPPELGNLASLEWLGLAGNKLAGHIPPELGNLANLHTLQLSNNQLTGEIPPELGNLVSLHALHLSENQFSGCIPDALRDVPVNDLAKLNVYPGVPFCKGGNPAIRVAVPVAVAAITAVPAAPSGQSQAEASDKAVLVAVYDASGGANWKNNDRWLSDAPIAQWYGVTTDTDGRVIEFDLSENNLLGEVPPELGDLTSLTLLNLRGNQFSGTIPAELANLTKLTRLFLKGNQLTGCIPAALLYIERHDLFNLGGLPICIGPT